MFKISSRFERAVAIGMIIVGLMLVALWSVEYIAVLTHPEFQLNSTMQPDLFFIDDFAIFSYNARY